MFNFKKKIKSSYNQGFSDGIIHQKTHDLAEKSKIKQFEVEQYVGKKVIAFSNEWENPIIGVGHHIEYITQSNSPVLVIQDYVENRKIYSLGIIKFYTEQKLNAILSLDPFSLIALVYHCYDTPEKFETIKRGERWENEKILKALKDNGFFDIP